MCGAETRPAFAKSESRNCCTSAKYKREFDGLAVGVAADGGVEPGGLLLGVVFAVVHGERIVASQPGGPAAGDAAGDLAPNAPFHCTCSTRSTAVATRLMSWCASLMPASRCALPRALTAIRAPATLSTTASACACDSLSRSNKSKSRFRASLVVLSVVLNRRGVLSLLITRAPRRWVGHTCRRAGFALRGRCCRRRRSTSRSGGRPSRPRRGRNRRASARPGQRIRPSKGRARRGCKRKPWLGAPARDQLLGLGHVAARIPLLGEFPELAPRPGHNRSARSCRTIAGRGPTARGKRRGSAPRSRAVANRAPANSAA